MFKEMLTFSTSAQKCRFISITKDAVIAGIDTLKIKIQYYGYL